MLGSVTRQKVWQPDAPSVSAASSSARPWALINGMSWRATNGKVTKRVASTNPGKAKMMRMSWSWSHGPNQPWAPNNSTNTSPETTGETEKGSSISAISAVLPGKSNLAIAQAAATPKMVLSGTEMAATSRVSLIDARASG